MSYKDLKFALSDAACYALDTDLGALFGHACPRLIDGLIVTLELLFISVPLGFILAVGLSFSRHIRLRVASQLAGAFVYFFRGTPLLAQLWLIYFGLGGLGQDTWGQLWPFVRDGWWIGLVVLTLNTSAYVAELIRGGIENLPRGQAEAAAAIGMRRRAIYRRILLPQALGAVWPAYGNELILLMKGSALVSTITVMDLMGQTRTVFARSYDLGIYLWAALLYLALAAMLTWLHRLLGGRICASGK
jgi:polar amino acid transport system permease protein